MSFRDSPEYAPRPVVELLQANFDDPAFRDRFIEYQEGVEQRLTDMGGQLGRLRKDLLETTSVGIESVLATTLDGQSGGVVNLSAFYDARAEEDGKVPEFVLDGTRAFRQTLDLKVQAL